MGISLSRIKDGNQYDKFGTLNKVFFFLIISYSYNPKTLKKENDFSNQVMTLKSTISMGHSTCAV